VKSSSLDRTSSSSPVVCRLFFRFAPDALLG
jgi:hypothetical protein